MPDNSDAPPAHAMQSHPTIQMVSSIAIRPLCGLQRRFQNPNAETVASVNEAKLSYQEVGATHLVDRLA